MKALVFFRWVLRLKLLLDTLKINFDEKGYAIKKKYTMIVLAVEFINVFWVSFVVLFFNLCKSNLFMVGDCFMPKFEKRKYFKKSINCFLTERWMFDHFQSILWSIKIVFSSSLHLKK